MANDSALAPWSDQLGRGYYPAGVDPFDLDRINIALRPAWVPMDNGKEITVGDRTVKIPTFANYLSGVGAVNDNQTWEFGSELVQELQTNLSLTGKYSMINGSGSVSLAVQRSISQKRSYSIAYSGNNSFSLVLGDDVSDRINPKLIAMVQQLPTGDVDDESILSQYQAFFTTWGSHMIRGMMLGNSIRATISRFNLSEDSFKTFTTAAKAEYNAVVNAAAIDFNASGNQDLKESLDTSSITINYVGGSPATKNAIVNSPYDKAKLQAWIDTQPDNPAVLQYDLVPIWSVLENRSDVDRERLPILRDAFYRIIGGGSQLQYGSIKSISAASGQNIPVKKTELRKAHEIIVQASFTSALYQGDDWIPGAYYCEITCTPADPSARDATEVSVLGKIEVGTTTPSGWVPCSCQGVFKIHLDGDYTLGLRPVVENWRGVDPGATRVAINDIVFVIHSL